MYTLIPDETSDYLIRHDVALPRTVAELEKHIKDSITCYDGPRARSSNWWTAVLWRTKRA